MKRSRFSVPSAAVFACGCLFFTFSPSSAGAAQIVWDDFESTAVGAFPTTFSDQNGQGIREVRDDSGALFGEDNQYLQVGGANLRIFTRVPGGTFNNLSTVAFDIVESSGIGTSDLAFGLGSGGAAEVNGDYGVFVFGVNNGAFKVSTNTTLESGELPAFGEDTPVRLFFLLNRTAVDASYLNPADPEGAALVLPAGRMTVWAQDLGSGEWSGGGLITTSLTNAPTQFVFRGFSTNNNEAAVDNFTVHNELHFFDPPHWNGGAEDGLWSSAGNWSNDAVPQPGSSLRFARSDDWEIENDLEEGIAYAGIEYLGHANSYELWGKGIGLSGSIVNRSAFAQTIFLPIELLGDLAVEPDGGALYLDGDISGGYGLSLSAANLVQLAGLNTFTGAITVTRGTLELLDDQTGVTGGMAVGIAAPSTINIIGDAAVAAENAVTLGTTTAVGTSMARLNVMGTLDNAGTLNALRSSTVSVSGTLEQQGPVNITGVGGYGAIVEAVAGGRIELGGAEPVAMTSGSNANGRALLKLHGGTLATPVGLEWVGNHEEQDGGAPVLSFSGGVLELTADVPELAADLTVLLEGGGGIVDTLGHSAGISSVISGAGALIKAGEGTLSLHAAPAWEGDTVVEAGVLKLSAAGLDDAAVVEVFSGATLHLDFEGTDRVGGLWFDGVRQGPGVWGAPGSGAEHEDARISGAGTLLVPQADPYLAWLDGFPGLAMEAEREKSADPDGDGRSNLVEFALNSDPTSGVRDGKTVHGAAQMDGKGYFTITLPVRGGAVFSGETSLESAPVDGLVYGVHGSETLDGTAASQVLEVFPALSAGLPALDEGWEYRSFRLAEPMDSAPRGFLRVSVTPEP